MHLPAEFSAIVFKAVSFNSAVFKANASNVLLALICNNLLES